MTELDACPMPSADDAPADEALRRILEDTRVVAVVGASPHSERTSHQIARYLLENTPYSVYLVNPAAGDATLDGRPFYASLADLPETPDMVDVFRREEYTPEVAREAVAVGASTLWLQLGIRNAQAAQIAADAGLAVVQNRCLKVEYARLLP